MALRIYDQMKHAIRYWLLRRLPACDQTVHMISQSMEFPLSVRERLVVKTHQWVCAWCQWYSEQLGLIRETARAKANVPLDGPGLSDEARERIRQALARPN